METEKKISVIIAEDHKLFSLGMAHLLESSGRFEILQKVENGNELIKCYPYSEADIIISDINMPQLSGMAAALKIREINPMQKIVFVSMYFDDTIANFCKKNFINGFLSKDSTAEELYEGLEKVYSGRIVFPTQVIATKETAPLNAKQEQFLMKLKLSHREIEIIQLIKQGKSSREIATELFLSEYTIETHRKNIFRKLSVKSVAGLIEFANNNGL